MMLLISLHHRFWLEFNWPELLILKVAIKSGRYPNTPVIELFG